jgi:hypothetical protein
MAVIAAVAVVVAPAVSRVASHSGGCCGTGAGTGPKIGLVATHAGADDCCADGCGAGRAEAAFAHSTSVEAESAVGGCCALSAGQPKPTGTPKPRGEPAEKQDKPGCPCEHGRCPCAAGPGVVVVAALVGSGHELAWADSVDATRGASGDEFAPTRSVGPPRRPPRG